MHAFEEIIRAMLETDGWWVVGDYRVDFSVQDKRDIGNPYTPGPGIDLLAYQPVDNRVAVIECKSLRDGLNNAEDFQGKYRSRYRLFTDTDYQRMLLRRLHDQFDRDRMVRPGVAYELWLIARYVSPRLRPDLNALFAEPHDPPWVLHGQEWLRDRLPRILSKANPDDAAVYAFQIATEIAEGRGLEDRASR